MAYHEDLILRRFRLEVQAILLCVNRMKSLSRATILICVCAFVAPSQEPENDGGRRPAALVSKEMGAKVVRAGRKGSYTIYSGEELFAGDHLTPRGGPVAVLYCAEGVAWTVNYSSPVVIGEFHPDSGATRSERCLFPLLERANALGADPAKIEDPSDDPLPDIPSAGPDASLVVLATRAARYQQAGKPTYSIRELRRLVNRYPQAAWGKRLIETEALKALAPAPAAQSSAHSDTYALLIGISKYQNDAVSHLQFAHEDAQSFASYLQSARGGSLLPCPPDHRGVPSEDCNIRTLINENATGAAVRGALDELFKTRGAKQDAATTLVIFAAAHGYFPCLAKADANDETDEPDCSGPEKDRETYLLTYDSTPESAAEIALPFARLTEMLIEHAPRYKRVLVYLDVCHAGVVPWLADKVAPPASAVTTAARRKTPKLGIFTASSRKAGERRREFAYESEVVQHGIFTHYLIAGLAGGRPPIGGNTLEFDLLNSWVTERVTSATAGRQKPTAESASTIIVVDDHSRTDFVFPPKDPSEIARTLDWVNRRPKSRAVGQPPVQDPDAWLEKLRREVSRGDPNSSKRLEIALEDAGNQVIYQYQQGDQVPQLPSAFECCRAWFAEALGLAPESTRHESRMLFCRARAALSKPDGYRSALVDLDRAIKLDPDRAYVHNALGLAYLQQIPEGGVEPQLAIAAFQDAIRISPHWSYPRHNLALTYALTGNYDAAIMTYQEAMRVRPDFSYLPYNLGLLYQKLNLRDEAIRNLRAALELAQKRRARTEHPPQRWTERAAIWSALGTLESRPGRAIPYFEKARIDDPGYLPAKHNEALAFDRSSRFGDAVKLWREVLDQDPDFTASLLALAEAYLRRGDLKNADENYRKIIEQLPGYIAGYRALARVETERGEYAQAIAHLNTAAAKSKLEPVQEQLARDRQDVASVQARRTPESPEYRAILKRVVKSR